ncbi:MAG TPA: D-alanine--D-alanine ligase, partial [Deltaproteobacteria bacterium]|nr:D-alanine--D-alanine ligase [Deltaproteobacteria bacterium]
MGGMSSEREVSIRSGTAVYNALIENGYKAIPIDVGRDIARIIEKKKIDAVFIALHGRYGEDGTIQGLLKMMGIPYTGSGVLASALAFDKAAAKEIFCFHNIPTSEFTVVRGKERVKDVLPLLPVVVKPAREGSTIGVTVVKNKRLLKKAVDIARRFDSKVVIERFIAGRELTVSVLNGKPLPVIEIRPKKGLYDYRSKYTKG